MSVRILGEGYIYSKIKIIIYEWFVKVPKIARHCTENKHKISPAHKLTMQRKGCDWKSCNGLRMLWSNSWRQRMPLSCAYGGKQEVTMRPKWSVPCNSAGPLLDCFSIESPGPWSTLPIWSVVVWNQALSASIASTWEFPKHPFVPIPKLHYKLDKGEQPTQQWAEGLGLPDHNVKNQIRGTLKEMRFVFRRVLCNILQ